jgi:hypothetical protein
MAASSDSPLTQAEQAAARRAQKRAEQEAAALRANLVRRKAQSRARKAILNPHPTKPQDGGGEKCP